MDSPSPPPFNRVTLHPSGADALPVTGEGRGTLGGRLAAISLDDDTAPRLPLELLYRILRLAIPVISNSEDLKGPASLKRYHFLCRASLVFGLRDEAQRLLWECVVIKSDTGSKSFLLSQGRGLKTRTLAFCGEEVSGRRMSTYPVEGSLAPGLVEEVIKACDRVECLSLKGVGGCLAGQDETLDYWLFASPSLGALKQLEIYRSVVFNYIGEDDYLYRRMPFTLTDLRLDNYWDTERLPEVLLIGLLNSGATTMRLGFETCVQYDGDGPYPENPLQPENVWFDSDDSEVGPFKPNYVRSLDLRLQDSWMLGYRSDGLLYFLDACDHLETLRTNLPRADALSRLPAPLRTLSLVSPDESDCQQVLSALAEGAKSLLKLETLEFAEPEGSSVESFEEEITFGREALRLECARRGIACVVTTIKDDDDFDKQEDSEPEYTGWLDDYSNDYSDDYSD